MNGFFVLDVPEFTPLVDAALRLENCKAHPKRGNYRFVEFQTRLDIRRGDTQMTEAIWYSCLTGGLIGKIVRFDEESLTLVATNEPILGPE